MELEKLIPLLQEVKEECVAHKLDCTGCTYLIKTDGECLFENMPEDWKLTQERGNNERFY